MIRRSPLRPSSPIARKAYLKRGKRPKKKARSRSERLRIYGPPGYVEWIHEQPCIACGVVGFSVVAHLKTGGTGRKADWTDTAPLCTSRMGGFNQGDMNTQYGCHQLYDEHRWAFDKRFPMFHASIAAEQTQSRWHSRISEREP